MKRFRYYYQSIIRFDAPIARHYFKLRCLPCENACQKIVGEELQLHPAVSLQHGTDAFGNRVQYGHTLEEHDSFVFTSSGEVELTPYRLPEKEVAPIFRLESHLTVPSAGLIAFSRQLHLPDSGDDVEKALHIAAAVYSHMEYRPGATGNDTDAAQAFARAQGVCQDYTHIFIALCRLNGIPARYANGFMPGIGFTHAWAEVHDGECWRGIDPTNNNRIECGYIKIAHGRDATDCPVNRGVFTGGGNQSSEIRILTEENTTCND